MAISALLLLVLGYGILFFIPVPSLLGPYSFSKAVFDEHSRLLRLGLSADDKFRLFVPLKNISQELIDATLLQEDRYFYWHPGINPIALVKAVWNTYIIHSRPMGASTITMQVARLRFGIYSKKPLGKLEQVLRALQLEQHYSKKEILEAYLNLAPYGGNIEGVGAASLIYFHQPVEHITLPQAITLTVIPQNPSQRTPDNKQLLSIRNKLFSRWLTIFPKDISKKDWFNLPMALYRINQLPFKAPHFVNSVLKQAVQSGTLQSSLDLQLQGIIERVTRNYLVKKKGLGVENAAVLLLDSRDMRVKSLLGSADYFNRSISGQINGAEIKRSPGSTLKPFIYGLALDQGLIHPHTILNDVPSSFNGYNPENFDYDFMGPISATEALVLSRNIPALYLANQLKPSLYHLLTRTHVSHLKSESYYGLSLNLGGAELTLRELVGLYAMLANEGVWYPVHFLSNQPKSTGLRLLSAEASFLVLDMLQQTAPPDWIYKTKNSSAVAWKTGTSSGYRDAWSIGVFGPYVLGVWIGNFDNKANPAFVGKNIAAPLFFDLIEAIQYQSGFMPPTNKDPEQMNLKKIEVCQASGMLSSAFCPKKEWTWFIPGKSPIKKDTVFREIAINSKTGLRTCHIDEQTRFEVFEFWPSDVLSVFHKAGIQRRIPPFFEKGCEWTNTIGSSPHISSPQSGVSYIVRANTRTHNKIPLTAITDSGVAFLYWFVDGIFLAKVAANKPYLWDAKPGTFTIRVVDERGLADKKTIRVELNA